MKNYYQILNIRPTATEDEIKRSYRVLAKRYHPDVNPGDETAADRFADINEAHNVLIDPKTRAEYDQKLKESQAPHQRPEDIIARQRAAAQAAARQAAMRNAFAATGASRAAYTRAAAAARAQAQAQAPTQAQAAAQAQNMQSQIAQIKRQAYKQGYDKGVAEGKVTLERTELKHVQKAAALEREISELKDRLAEIEHDRSDLEQELFNRDKELKQEQQLNRELEQQIDALKQTAKKSQRAVHDEATALKTQLDKAKTKIATLEAEKREVQLKNQAQISLQQDKRRELQAEIDELHRQVESLTEEVEALRSDNEQWQQYAKSEEFISDAEQRLQEWDKKQKADKKLAKGTLYGFLGVLIWAPDEEIQAAYTKLEKRYSRSSDAASAEKLQKIKEAYETLSDPDKRRAYNESIGITDERIESERIAIDENNKLEEEYRRQLESKEFWAEFDDLTFNAQTGDADAQNKLGEMYYYGDEIEQDVDQAVYWFKEAAKQKHADAMYNLGVCFINGEGVDRNPATGLGFIRQAAKLGSEPAKKYVSTSDKSKK